MEPHYVEMLRFVRDELGDVAGGHGSLGLFPFRSRYQHTRRVLGWALRLLEHEQADRDMVVPAAIFHDCGYRRRPDDTHALVSAELCRAYLDERGFPREQSAEIEYLVQMHSEKTQPPIRLSPELRVLMDADLLDEVGAIAILWDAMDEGAQAEQSYVKTFHRLEEMHRRLCEKRVRMFTPAGLRMYDESLQAARAFLNRLHYELCLEEDIPG